MKNLKFMVEQANKELKEVIQYLESVQECFEIMDLKLYDLSWAICSDGYFEKYDSDYLSNMFNLFCEDNYNWFCEWEAEEGIDKNIRQYIGRTSSFYLDSKDIFNRGEFYLDEVLLSMLEYNLGYYYTDWTSCIPNDIKETQISYKALQEYFKGFDKRFLDEEVILTKEGLKYISSGALLKDVKGTLEDAIKEYNYIKEFKENSIEYFKEFLKCNEEEEEF